MLARRHLDGRGGLAMPERIGREVAIAAADVVALCRIDVAAVYPITPNTHIAEHLSEIVSDGHLDAEFITVESEHSALSAVVGASATGARSFTATSSQGLMYMHEIMPIASAMRLPIVMAIGNRAVSGPLNILNDHGDIMMERDTGWISLFAQNGQECLDMLIQAFKIAEHKDVMLPVNVNIDGFILTHMVEAMEMPNQKEVDRFLPPFKPSATLHPDKPISMGPFAGNDIYTEISKAKDVALTNSKKVILEVWKEWRKLFGRNYEPIEAYRADNAEILLIMMGSMSETAEIAVDTLRAKGQSVGLLKLKLWRPFPFEELKKAVKGAKVLAVIDRAIAYGGPGGPVAGEIRSALYDEAQRPAIVNYIVGLGGRDVTPEDFMQIIKSAAQAKKKAPKERYVIYGVRE
jgi:pyruvate ferredoxin oxidoreductase alpha subunit